MNILFVLICSDVDFAGVNANVVAIGTVESPSIWRSALDKDPSILNKIGSKNPRGKARVLCPVDIAARARVCVCVSV